MNQGLIPVVTEFALGLSVVCLYDVHPCDFGRLLHIGMWCVTDSLLQVHSLGGALYSVVAGLGPSTRYIVGVSCFLFATLVVGSRRLYHSGTGYLIPFLVIKKTTMRFSGCSR